MKKYIIPILVTIMASFIAIMIFYRDPYPYTSVEGDPFETRIYRLDNGLTVYLSKNDEKPEIETSIAVRAGAQDDPLESTGLAHYQEHLMFKGTQQIGTMDYVKEKQWLDMIDSLYEVYGQTNDILQRKHIYHLIDSCSYEASKYLIANEYDKLMTIIGAGGNVNAYTSNDRTCFVSLIPSNEIERWLFIEADRMQNQVVRAFHTELETVYEEYNMYSTDDYEIVDNAINKILYPNLPYRQHTVLGTPEDLKNPSLKNIKKFYQTFYRPNNIAICLSGDIDYDKTIALIDKYFGQWQPQEIPARHSYPDYNLSTAKDTVVYGQEADNLFLVWKMPPYKHPDVDILTMLAKVLKNDNCGLLDVDLIQEQKLLNIYVYADKANDFTSFYIYAEPKQNQTEDELKNLILQEIEKLKNGDFDEKILQAVISNFKRQEMEYQKSNEARVRTFESSFINNRPYSYYVHQIDTLAQITKADIVRVANTYLTDTYACIRKRKTDKMNATPIEKPQITPILLNRDSISLFTKNLMNAKTTSITPRFLDFETDIQHLDLKNGQELLYVKNNDNDIFNLSFILNTGKLDHPYLRLVPTFLPYLGTDTLSSGELKKQLYSLATDVDITVRDEEMKISVSGLQENFIPSLKLLESWVLKAKSDETKYKEIVRDIVKETEDAKTMQFPCFYKLMTAGMMGLKYISNHVLTPYMMRSVNGEYVLSQFRQLLPQIATVTYFGPADKDNIMNVLNKNSNLVCLYDSTVRQSSALADCEVVTEPQVWIVPFKAPNICMIEYANRGEIYDAKNEAVSSLFNTYFSGGMDGIVFQELREARALAYTAWSYYCMASKKNKYNVFYNQIISQNDKLADCVTTFDTLCNVMPVSQSAFENAKTTLLKQMETNRVSTPDIIPTYLAYRKKGWQEDMNKQIYEEVKKLTLDDIVRFQETCVKNSTYRYLILGDESKLDLNYIRTLGPIKRLSLTDIFGF